MSSKSLLLLLASKVAFANHKWIGNIGGGLIHQRRFVGTRPVGRDGMTEAMPGNSNQAAEPENRP
jgi:hypothetical protein